MSSRPGLGRGLEALIPTSRKAAEEAGLEEIEGASLRTIPVKQIVPNPRQPRAVFDEQDMEELVHSIKEIGLLQPIVVRPTGKDSYELIMGERRWRATQKAGLDSITAVVRETSDEDLLRDALLENLHRSELNPLEEAAAYQQLLDDFGCTQEELSERIGRSRPQISNTIRLLKLAPAVQRRVAAKVISAGHARALLAVTNPELQERLATRVVAEGISVRQLEEIVQFADEGSGSGRQQSRALPKATSPRVEELAHDLSEHFDTRVKVNFGKTKGKITIEFATIGDLERIVELINPPRTN